MRNKKGFTLIELLVVIAIIGILATIGLVALNGAREKARDATRKSDLSQVKTALVLYADDNSTSYPSVDCNSVDGTSTNGCIFNTTCSSSTANPICNTYISKAVSDPTNNATYRYVYEECTSTSTNNSTFVLYATLESPANTYFYIGGDGTSGDKQSSVPACTSF